MNPTIVLFPSQPKAEPTLTVFAPALPFWRGKDWPSNPVHWLQARQLYPLVGIACSGWYGPYFGMFTRVTL